MKDETKTWTGAGYPANTMTVNMLAERVAALADRWADPEFWKDEGAAMDSHDCAQKLRKLLTGEDLLSEDTR